MSGGIKHDSGKAPCDLLSPIALMGTARVLGYGAKKYASHNWRLGIAYSRITGAILRHLFAFMSGEDNDPETGLPHVDHLGCEIMFLQEMTRTHKNLDDRYKDVGTKFVNFEQSWRTEVTNLPAETPAAKPGDIESK